MVQTTVLNMVIVTLLLKSLLLFRADSSFTDKWAFNSFAALASEHRNGVSSWKSRDETSDQTRLRLTLVQKHTVIPNVSHFDNKNERLRHHS